MDWYFEIIGADTEKMVCVQGVYRKLYRFLDYAASVSDQSKLALERAARIWRAELPWILQGREQALVDRFFIEYETLVGGATEEELDKFIPSFD